MSSTNRQLIQVVARLQPTRCGVSDYAVLLAQELESSFGIDTAFVVVNSTEPCESRFPRVYCAQSQLLEACTSLTNGQPGTLLIQLSGYGFSGDGAPLVLAGALAKVRESGRFQIAAYFHELFATAMPWKSAFWHSKRQQRAINAIAEQCDLLVTNLQPHADWLERNTMRRSAFPIQLLPVSSNVGETCVPAPMTGRKPAMVVFGMAATRQRAYQRLSALKVLLGDLGVEEIVDVGPELNVPPDVHGIPVTRKGILSAADIGLLLSDSRFGFVPHLPHALAKSGIFAGYCALGSIPVIPESFLGEVDGLKDGVHMVSPGTAKAALADGLEHCSTAAWSWYTGHRLHVHAETFARLFAPSAVEKNLEAVNGRQGC